MKSSVVYNSNQCVNQKNHAHSHSFQKSQISLTMKHETKHKDHQRREDEVANLWRTWMSEISTKHEKMDSTFSPKCHEEETARAR